MYASRAENTRYVDRVFPRWPCVVSIRRLESTSSRPPRCPRGPSPPSFFPERVMSCHRYRTSRFYIPPCFRPTLFLRRRDVIIWAICMELFLAKSLFFLTVWRLDSGSHLGTILSLRAISLFRPVRMWLLHRRHPGPLEVHQLGSRARF
jgi:hypothetical protein